MINKICKLSHVVKKYKNHTVLNDINLSIDAGSMVAITGSSGTGKTTLINIMGLLEKPDSGDVSLFGIKNMNNESKTYIQFLRSKIGYLFQNYALVESESVEYNLNIALKFILKNKNEKKNLMLKVINDLSLNCKLNQKIYELSGGEQQKISLARLILKENEIIFADEPTGSLDSENRESVLTILKDLNKKGKTIVIVTHDSIVAEKCDNIINLDILKNESVSKLE